MKKLTQKQTDKIFTTITANGCRKMTPECFNRGVNEAIIIAEEWLTGIPGDQDTYLISDGEMTVSGWYDHYKGIWLTEVGLWSFKAEYYMPLPTLPGKKQSWKKEIKICKFCTKIFKPKQKVQEFCSRTCSGRYGYVVCMGRNAPKPKIRTQINCQQCDTLFEPKYREKKDKPQKFCSRKCVLIYMRKKLIEKYKQMRQPIPEAVKKHKKVKYFNPELPLGHDWLTGK